MPVRRRRSGAMAISDLAVLSALRTRMQWHQAPPTINGRGINDRQAGHAPAIGTGTEAIIGKSANQPGGGADQGQHGHEG